MIIASNGDSQHESLFYYGVIDSKVSRKVDYK